MTKRDSVTVDAALVRRLANTVRGLAIDGTEAADSGHPGLPLGAADFAVTLWYYFLRYNPDDVAWAGRDRFVLSAGHGSMLIYALLHLAGYDLPMEELKRFRQIGSRTPGHPENFMTAGVETTTGPLGAGFTNGVGMALADRMLAARVHRSGFTPITGFVYAIVSDGDLMEGVALEAASFAGHMKLGNMIYLYDDNNISLDGPTSLSFQEDTPKKFEAMGWHVQTVDGHDPVAVGAAIEAAQAEADRPSLICCRTTIGFGSPNKAGTSGVHGSPLGEAEAKLTKEKLGLPAEKFHVPAEDRAAWAARKAANKAHYDAWQAQLRAACTANPDAVAALEGHFSRTVPADLAAKLPKFDPAKKVATRKAGAAVLKAIAPEVPWLVGGSADLSVSTNAAIDSDGKLSPDNLRSRHIFFGVREHGMGGIVNGMTRHGAFRAFGATFLTFSDYMRGAVRLAALMHAPSIFVFTHDSVFLGEDGPTHQPVEHVMALRLIPQLNVFRPADAVETGEAWVAALQDQKNPSAICLSRQDLPVYDRSTAEFATVGSGLQGGYILRPEKPGTALDAILIGTGSEVALCVDAARLLEAEGLNVRVVSLPSWEVFARQSAEYRDKVLPVGPIRVAAEAGVTTGWQRWVGDRGAVLGIDHFGTSAPAKEIAKAFGFTAENLAGMVKKARG